MHIPWIKRLYSSRISSWPLLISLLWLLCTSSHSQTLGSRFLKSSHTLLLSTPLVVEEPLFTLDNSLKDWFFVWAETRLFYIVEEVVKTPSPIGFWSWANFGWLGLGRRLPFEKHG